MNIPDKAIGAAETAWYEAADLEDALKAAAPFIAAHALREAAAMVDVEGSEVDWEETTYGAGRRHAADEIEAIADELDPQ